MLVADLAGYVEGVREVFGCALGVAGELVEAAESGMPTGVVQIGDALQIGDGALWLAVGFGGCGAEVGEGSDSSVIAVLTEIIHELIEDSEGVVGGAGLDEFAEVGERLADVVRFIAVVFEGPAECCE